MKRKMRIGDQMQCVLLALLKADRSRNSLIGQVMSRNADAFGRSGLSTMDLMKFLKGPLAFNADDKLRHSVRRSFWRSLRKLVEYGLIYEVLEKSPGKHGYLYRLTPKGEEKAMEIWAEVSMFINEYSSLV